MSDPFAGTYIGVDGKRHRFGEETPTEAGEESRRALLVYGIPKPGMVPTWNADNERLEWGPGGSYGGPEDPRLDEVIDQLDSASGDLDQAGDDLASADDPKPQE